MSPEQHEQIVVEGQNDYSIQARSTEKSVALSSFLDTHFAPRKTQIRPDESILRAKDVHNYGSDQQPSLTMVNLVQ
jgi:hypothetical protein